MKTYTADFRIVFRLQVALLFPCALLLFAAAVFLPRFGSAFWISVFVFAGIYTFAAFFWLPRFFSRLRIYLSTRSLSLYSGVFTRTQRTLRMEAVQYCAQLHTPRFFRSDMEFVVAHAPGARIVLPFLSKQDAGEIATALNNHLRKGSSAHE